MMNSPTILILAGEVSGDRYGSELCKALRNHDRGVSVIGTGGDRMADSGVELIAHIRDLAIMGFAEVVSHLTKVRHLQNNILTLIVSRRIDAVVCIDFPDFNISLARRIRKLGNPPKLFYFVPPQVWIWRASRVDQLRDLFEAVFPIFEFEHQFLLQNNVRSLFFGHPLQDFLKPDEYPENHHENQDALHITLLPGSRSQEIERILPIMLSSVKHFRISFRGAIAVTIGRAPLPEARFHSIINNSDLPEAISVTLSDAIAAAIAGADIILSKSGTVNLEIAYAARPAVIIYRTSWLTYYAARILIDTKFISLINILAGKEVVREFIQHHARPDAIAQEMRRILFDRVYRNQMIRSMKEISLSKNPTPVHGSVARAILDSLRSDPQVTHSAQS